MPLETFGNIDDLVPANPDDDDLVLQGAAHRRGITESLQGKVGGGVDDTRLLVDDEVAFLVNALRAAIRRPLSDDPELAFRNQADDADLVLLVYDNASDTFRIASITGPVALDFANVRAMLTTATGIRVGPPATNARVDLLNSADVIAARVTGTPSGAEVIAVQVGGQARLANELGNLISTSSSGCDVTREGGGATTLNLINTVNDLMARIQANGAGDTIFEVLNPNRGIQLRGADAGGSPVTIIALSAVGSLPGSATVLFSNPAGSEIARFGAAEAQFQTPVRTTQSPSAAQDLTRKDYVDGRSQGNIAQRQIVVNGVMLLAGITTAVGQSVSVTYATPFSGATPVVSLTVNAAAGNNAFAFITNSTLTGFTATAGLSGAGVHWMAQGAL